MENREPVKFKHILQTMLLGMQFMCIIMMFFCGWLGTKMEIPDGAMYFWFITNFILFIPHFLIKDI